MDKKEILMIGGIVVLVLGATYVVGQRFNQIFERRKNEKGSN